MKLEELAEKPTKLKNIEEKTFERLPFEIYIRDNTYQITEVDHESEYLIVKYKRK